MKVLLGILLAASLLIDTGKIGKVNKAKSEGKEAFQSGDYKTAVRKYKYLVDTLGVREDEVMMNLAHAYFHSKDSVNAFSAYQPLAQSSDPGIRSLANQQLGVLANRQGRYEEALNFFKQAMKAAPLNEDARYNYEMVKKKLDEKKKQDQNQDKNKENKENKDKKEDKNKDQKDQQNKDKKDNKDQNKDQQKKDQKDKDQKEKEKKEQQEKDRQEKEKQEKDKQEKEKQQQQKGEQQKDDKNKQQKDIPPSVAEKLKEMQMSEEKAKMILEAMKHQEIQYLQQNKRKATRPKDKGKPDW